MVRIVVAMLVVFAAMLPGLAADDAPARYRITATPGGFTRLDTRTGAVSHCSKQGEVWRCVAADGVAVAPQPAAPEAPPPPGIDARLDAMTARLDRLSANVAALAAAVDRLKPEPPAVVAEERSFPEEAMSRLTRLVAGMKRQLTD